MDSLIRQRQEKDKFFKANPYAPLSPQQQAKFDHLNYYDPNPALVFTITPEVFAEKSNVKMQTSTGETRYYQRWGKIAFQVDGQKAELTLYAAPGDEQFFVPFKDATNGTETYGAGRYIEVEPEPDCKIHIDFNAAYNPYCAYSPHWSCPIPPMENRLKVPIRAGEKIPTGDWVELEPE